MAVVGRYDLRIGVELSPSLPGQLDEWHHRKTRAVLGTAASPSSHLRPKRLRRRGAVVHDQVVLIEQAGHTEIDPTDGTPVEREARPRERTVGHGHFVAIHV